MKPGKIKQTPLAIGFWPEKKISNPAFVLSCGNNFTYTYSKPHKNIPTLSKLHIRMYKTCESKKSFISYLKNWPLKNFWQGHVKTMKGPQTNLCFTLKRITVHAVIFLQLNISQKSSAFPLFQLYRPTFFRNCPTKTKTNLVHIHSISLTRATYNYE